MTKELTTTGMADEPAGPHRPNETPSKEPLTAVREACEFCNRPPIKTHWDQIEKRTVQVCEVHAFGPAAKRLTSDAVPGRNDPCPCGSGKKFKKCCL